MKRFAGFFIPLYIIFACSLLSCKKDDEIKLDETSVIKVAFNYPDKTPIKNSRIELVRLPDKNDSTFFSQVKYIEDGPITFYKLKEGNYSILAHTSSDNQYIFSSTSYRDTVVKVKANSVDVELLAGVQFFFHSGTEYKGAASFSNQLSDNPTRTNSHVGMAHLLDYYPAKYRIGNRYDVVKRVVVNTQIVDIDASQVQIKLYKIPKDISWNSLHTGILSYEYFQSLTPSAIYPITLPKGNADYHGTPEFEIDPTFFFGAENGIAYVLEAKTLLFFDVPSIRVEYKWEK